MQWTENEQLRRDVDIVLLRLKTADLRLRQACLNGNTLQQVAAQADRSLLERVVRDLVSNDIIAWMLIKESTCE